MDSLWYSSTQDVCRDQDVCTPLADCWFEANADSSFLMVRIASLLHVHLGVDDDGENKTKAGKARTKDQTAAERFHSFRDVHSAAWHEHRDRVAQSCMLRNFSLSGHALMMVCPR